MATKTKSSKIVSEMATNKMWSVRGDLRKMVEELQRQRDSRVDIVLDGRDLEVTAVDGKLFLNGKSAAAREHILKPQEIRPVALGKLCERTNPGIPAGFARELAVARPELASHMFHDLLNHNGKRHLVRMLDGYVRTVLSDGYLTLDDLDICMEALNVADTVGAKVLEASLSETTSYIKLVDYSVWGAINDVRTSQPAGGWFAGGLGNREYLQTVGAHSGGELPGGPGTVHPVVTIRNSGTGHGSANVRLGILAGICFNLATVEKLITQVHIGEKMDVGLYTAETHRAAAKTIMLKLRDTIRTAFEPNRFKAIVAKINNAVEVEITRPASAIGNLVSGGHLPEGRVEALMQKFLGEYGGKDAFGLGQAVSRLAQDTKDADNADDLETLAGDILLGAHNQLLTVR